MRKILHTIIAILIISGVYLTTQAFDVIKNSEKEESTWYNQNIDGDFTFTDFTTFSIVYNAPTGCNATCGPGQKIQTVRGCFGNDGVAYNANNYEACGGNPGNIITSCNAGPCYTGSWIVSPAPACQTSCGYAGGTVFGTVTCSTGRSTDCNPNTKKPSPSTRSCAATSACPTNRNCETADGVIVNHGATVALYDTRSCSSLQKNYTCNDGVLHNTTYGSGDNKYKNCESNCKEAQWSPIMGSQWARPSVNCIHAVATNCSNGNHAGTYAPGQTTYWCPKGFNQPESITCVVRDCTSTQPTRWRDIEFQACGGVRNQQCK